MGRNAPQDSGDVRRDRLRRAVLQVVDADPNDDTPCLAWCAKTGHARRQCFRRIATQPQIYRSCVDCQWIELRDQRITQQHDAVDIRRGVSLA